MTKRDRRFILSFSRDEKRQLAQLAESEGGLSQAGVLRWLLHRELRRKGLETATGQACNGDRTVHAESSEEMEDE